MSPRANHRAGTQPAFRHIQELRHRLLMCVLVVLAGASLGYVWRTTIVAFLQRPLGQSLFYTSPTGSFEFIMRICLLAGFLAALPVLLYQIVRFIEPALPRRLGQRPLLGLIIASCGLMLAGVAFAYYVSLPAALHFFNTVGAGSLHALISADQYFNFVFTYLATFAAVFQLPLLLLFINRITPLPPAGLRRYRKWVVLGSFTVALITPSAPDPLSQVILALPIIALYEISIGLVWLANRHRQPRQPVVAARPPAAPAKTPPAGGVLDLRAAPAAPAKLQALTPRANILDLR